MKKQTEGRHVVVDGKQYNDDALSCFFAPLYPDLARNNLWVVTKC
jgi:hypothetical protein